MCIPDSSTVCAKLSHGYAQTHQWVGPALMAFVVVFMVFVPALIMQWRAVSR